MRPPLPFTSAIGPTIARYVALKQALGRRFGTQRYLLARFDGFLAACHATDLTAETFSAWGSSITHLMPSGRRMRMQMVRQFCLYRRRSDPACFVPDPSQFPPPQPRRRPHVFSEDEIARLLCAAGALRRWGASPLYRQVARLALVLLYTSGLRRGELVRLTLGDYDPVEHVLRVRDSKFYKSRMVPLSTDAVREIGRYLEDRSRRRFPSGADAPLLLHRRGGGFAAYSGNGLRVLMRHLFQTAGVRTASGHVPRVHDLRYDNPFSEAQFRTLKYRPEFPDRFGSLAHARTICHDLFAWYTDAHYHSGLRYLRPADVHYGRATMILERRHGTRLAAYAAHPERFVQGPPRPETLPPAVWINPPTKTACEDAPGTTIVVPTDPQHGVILRPPSVLEDRPIVLVNSVESLQ